MDSRRLLLATWVVLACASLPAVLDSDAVGRAASLRELADGSRPYFVPASAGLLYAWAPIVVLSSCVLFITPGLLLAAMRPVPDPMTYLVRSFAVALVVVSVSAGLAQGLVGGSLRGAAFGWLVLLLGTACAAIAALLRRDERVRQTIGSMMRMRGALALMLLVPAAVVAGLAPKFYWEAFNGDGAHAFESSRLLLTQSVPFWPRDAGPVSGFPGFTTMLFAFPASWFIRLFGPIEASSRLPLILYLPVLTAAIAAAAGVGRGAAAASVGREGVLRLAEHALIWLALAAYTLAMAFSATYSPYSADIALPATQDTLLMICYLGFIVSFVGGSTFWLCVFAVLTYVSLPSGLILIAFWIAGVALSWRPLPISRLKATAAALALCIAGVVATSMTLRLFNLPPPGGEYGVGGLLRYFAFLQFTDVWRILYVAIPSGLIPIAALCAVRRQDHIARALSFVTVAYFLFFYVQAYVSLHHFVPAMILPLVVLWRSVPSQRYRWRLAIGAAGVLAVALAWPSSSAIHTTTRAVGASIDDRIGGYDRSAPTQMASTTVLGTLFKPNWDPSVPQHAYGGSPIAWNHYAQRSATTAQQPINYIVQARTAPAPANAHLAAEDDRAALYIVDTARWRADAARQPPALASSWWLAVPRSTLFRTIPGGTAPVVDVTDTLERLGLDPQPLLERLGVRR